MKKLASPRGVVLLLGLAVGAFAFAQDQPASKASAQPASSPEEKKILLTFDNLPAMKPLGFWTPREVSNAILRTLESHQIKAAGFVIAEKIEDDPNSFVVLEDWVSRGHILGNQTFANVDLNELSAEDFIDHVRDGQKPLWTMSKRIKFNFRYLRFPQLHEGNDPGKKKEVRSILGNAGYETVPVTVKTSDYRFNRPYVEGQGSPERIQALRKAYLQHVSLMLDRAEAQSQAVWGRNITHIVWLHGGVATANFLEDVITLLKGRGYSFVSLPEALSDPAFKTEEKYVGPLGLSFIDRVAATKGLPFDEKYGEIVDPETEKLLSDEE